MAPQISDRRRTCEAPPVDFVVRLVVSVDQAELATDRLWADGATAVEEQAGDGSQVALVAGFPTAAAAATVARSVGAELIEVDEATWRDVWRQHAQPVRVGSMIVAPAWREVEVGGADLVVSIDPGGCFGSGSHPTTRLMLAELQRRMVAGATVFDVGTGSGVLAVAAARLGAGRVVAVDIEPDAVTVTRRNAETNRVAERIEVSTDDAADVAETFDVVVANLTAAVLAGLAETLVAAVAPRGVLLLSGLLPGQWPHIAGRFDALSMLDLVTLEGWVGVVLTRNWLSKGDPRRSSS
jgi:ribosomal protein L11 methyltransferase